MSVKVEGIELQISSDGSKAKEGLTDLARGLSKVKDACDNLNIASVASGIKKLADSITKVDIEKLDSIASALERIKGAFGGNMKVSISSSAIKAAEKAAENAKAANLVDSAAKTESGASGKIPRVKEEAEGATKAIKNLDKAAHSASKNGLAKLGAAFKRILFYRAIRTVIKEIAQAFREGTNNAYQYSKAIAGPLAANMDKLATSILFMKNGLGAAVAPIINALTPMITRLADAIANLGNTIAGVIAKLTGQSTYIKAIKNMTEYADATNAAAKAQRQLLGFDELNVLTASGGGAGSNTDYSKMFETVNTDTFNFGDAISNGLKEAVEKLKGIDWESLPAKIKEKITTAIKEYPFAENFNSVGEFIGTALISALKFGKGVLELLFGDYINAELEKLGSKGNMFTGAWAIANGILEGIIYGLGNLTLWAWQNIVDPLVTGIINGMAGTEFSSLSDVFQPIADYFNKAIYQIQVQWQKLIIWLNENTPFNFKVPEVDIGLSGKGKVGQLGDKIKELQNQGKYYYDKATSKPITAPASAITNPLGTVAQVIGRIWGGFQAEGGYPAQGSLFVAGEMGPELVSNINGRTGVINNDQFATIVMTAAENVINAILASGQDVAGAVENNKPSLSINGRQLARVIYPDLEREGQRIGPSAVSVV